MNSFQVILTWSHCYFRPVFSWCFQVHWCWTPLLKSTQQAWWCMKDTTAQNAVNVWENLKVWCLGWEWLTFGVFYELQGIDTMEKAFLVKIVEYRFVVRWGIALLIFFLQMSLNFPKNVDLVLQANVWKNKNINCGFSNEAISLKSDKWILLPDD